MKSLPVALPLEVDKEKLYGEYMSRTRWMDKLYRKGCHKSLDIPDDDMNFNHQTHGISGKHLLGIGAMVLAGLLGWRALDKTTATPGLPDTTTAVPSTGTAPAPQEYDVTFWVDDKEIVVTEPGGNDE